MLEALFPGRIDLGIGRAPGGDQRTAHAVAGGAVPERRRLPAAGAGPRRLSRRHAARGPSAQARARAARRRRPRPRCGCSAPRTTAARSPRSSGCASPSRTSSTRSGGDAVTRAYRARFPPSAREAAPARDRLRVRHLRRNAMREAERLAATIDLRRLHMALNMDTPVPTLAEAERAHLHRARTRLHPARSAIAPVIGDPDRCRRELQRSPSAMRRTK